MIKKNYIPTINISSLLDNKFETNESLGVIKKIQKACVDVGFFQIINHGINLKEINKISKIGENFFELDIKDKMRLSPNKWNKRNKNIYRGYFPNDVNGKEGLDLGDLRVTKKYSQNLNNQFIEYIDLKKSFNKKATEELSNYYDDMFNLGETLFKCIIKLYNNNTNISKKAFSRLKTLSTLRFNYYPKQTKPVEISKQDGVALGCETHVDSSIFTILYQNKIAGLQLQNKATKMWHDVPVNKSAFVVNTGRALEFLSNGLFKATNHRVLWNKKKRLSIPFFFEPSFDFKMSNAFLNNSKKGYNKVKYEFFLKNSLKKFIEYKR
tara:strand:- start:18 stop:989 length:972 start_codon:yes stop_codon:yes gene_type:complete